MTTIIVNEKTSKGKSLLEFLRKFENENFVQIEKTQNMELDKLIDQTEKDIKQGRTKKIKTADLWK
jgi:low affinity Fe/Cu permease